MPCRSHRYLLQVPRSRWGATRSPAASARRRRRSPVCWSGFCAAPPKATAPRSQPCAIWWATQPDYRVLYAGLSGEEAAAITGKLQAKAIPFKLAAGASTILVPADQAMQIHLDLTAEGTLGSSKIGKGFELFDQPMTS